ncbi:MAG TPA: alpha/beta hydrolase [Arthrobacter sp.]|nr:alpha/beta hydrolase [Arthrobacter sp.]
MDGSWGSVTSCDGTRIGFLTEGSGPPLLLVHGGMCTSARWDPLWQVLVPRFRVTAMDRRGRGSSGDGGHYSLAAEAADVTAVAGHLSKRHDGAPVDVFGHSYGALCALGAAGKGAPLRRVALYEPPGPPTVSKAWLRSARTSIDSGHPGRAMYSFLVDVVGLHPEEVAALRDRPLQYDPMPIIEQTLVREAEALTTVDLAALAGSITQSVLLLLGSESPAWAAEVTRNLERALQLASVVLIPEQGHEAVDVVPDLIADQLERFLLD